MKRGIAALAASVVLVLPSLADATHPRPKSAKPFRASLVQAYAQCLAPDRTHGPPLGFPSCSGPQQASRFLTVGNPPATAARFAGSVNIRVYGTPGPPTDNVVLVAVEADDVRCQGVSGACPGAGDDYAGTLRFEMGIRATDHDNAVAPGGGNEAATVEDFGMAMTVDCVPTSDPAIGSSCHREEAHWNIFGQYPIDDDKRTIWELGQTHIYDGGADGDGATTADNTLFAVQGVFIP
jgi:hypothetical protein